MPQFESPFNESERQESQGEASQRLASYGQTLLTLIGVELEESERQGLAKVINAFIRKWPELKDVMK